MSSAKQSVSDIVRSCLQTLVQVKILAPLYHLVAYYASVETVMSLSERMGSRMPLQKAYCKFCLEGFVM